MKNLFILVLFMFSASNLKQDKPVTDSINKPYVEPKTQIDTTAYILPEKTPLDQTLEKVKDLNYAVQEANKKALEVERNAKRRNAEKKADEAFKTLDKLPTKIE